MTLTLADIPSELDAALRQRADEQHLSVDQVAVAAIRIGLGLPEQPGHDEKNLAASIRARFGPLGGVELATPVREPIKDPVEFPE